MPRFPRGIFIEKRIERAGGAFDPVFAMRFSTT
jgi:hypothetical protein